MSQNLAIDEGTGRKLACDDISLHAETVSRQGVMEIGGAFDSDRATCAVAGTANAFKTGATVECRKVDIQAETDNTGRVAVGGVSVKAAVGTSCKGIVLMAGDTYTVYVRSLNELYIDATVSGDGVTYNYFA